jgi:hypothetical protein
VDFGISKNIGKIKITPRNIYGKTDLKTLKVHVGDDIVVKNNPVC